MNVSRGAIDENNYMQTHYFPISLVLFIDEDGIIIKHKFVLSALYNSIISHTKTPKIAKVSLISILRGKKQLFTESKSELVFFQYSIKTLARV